MKILMLAAENGALPHGKVGGMGDVIRDLPRAIVDLGHEVTVMTPGYGIFPSLPATQRIGTLNVPFAGATERVEWHRLRTGGPVYEFLEHPLFSPRGPGRIYVDDGDGPPFYSDATKFAFFCAAAAAAALELAPDIVHLHDWHTGAFLALRRFDRRFADLTKIRTVYTIHNLALQGQRPVDFGESSWRAWYPWLRYDSRAVGDPVYPDCVNPAAIAIRHADRVTTVSPTYAAEIVRPNDPARGFHGGEGLENELAVAASEGRLTGILNGCDYSEQRPRRPGWKRFVELLSDEVHNWIANERTVRSSHFLALERIDRLPKRRPSLLLTSVGRTTAQKTALFGEPIGQDSTALDEILANRAPNEWFVMAGSGAPELEDFFRQAMHRHPNFLYLNGFSDAIAAALYSRGDLFLMPSTFEPCGISQMLAMRAGQPCVVHGVGGLNDTVSPRCGFVFRGETPTAQGRAFVAAVESAAAVQREGSTRWTALRTAAAAQRFDWDASARRYIDDVYAHGAD